jgi:ATP-dependent Zn protease
MIARQMVGRWGMSPAVGPVAKEPEAYAVAGVERRPRAEPTEQPLPAGT